MEKLTTLSFAGFVEKSYLKWLAQAVRKTITIYRRENKTRDMQKIYMTTH